MKEKMKWVGKYISRPILIIILLLVCLKYFYPQALDNIGLTSEVLGKYAFYFFALKGVMWLIVLGYGFFYLKNRNK
jgi:hypothetical protein